MMTTRLATAPRPQGAQADALRSGRARVGQSGLCQDAATTRLAAAPRPRGRQHLPGLVLRLLVAVALLCAGAAACAANLPWTGKPFQIVASEKPLADLLRELAASQGTTAVIDGKVSGTISGRFAGSPKKTLDSLCATYGLSWYYDGSFLYIDPSADARSEVLSIGNSPGNAGWLVQSLTQLRIYDPRYPLLVSGRDGTARVTGPKRYVEMVRQVARLLDSKSALNDGAEIRIFPLKYAWAGDFRITRSGKEVAVPGVAATLRSLYGHAGGGGRPRSSTASTHATIRVNPILPARNAATAISFAALSTAGAAPPARTASRARRVAGKRDSSGRRNVSSPISARSSGVHGVSIRAGQARHEAIGTRISDGPSWARVEPSRYSTIEWTTDCGWMTMSMRSGSRPKR